MEFGQTLSELRVELASCIGSDKIEGIPWSWVAAAVSRILSDHSSGVSRAVVLTELEAAWHRHTSSEEQDSAVQRTLGGFFLRGNTAPALASLFELRVVGLTQLPHTSIWMWQLAGSDSAPRKGMRPPQHSSKRQMAAFVHQRFYAMLESAEFEAFFAASRAVYMAGLRTTACDDELRLLPTTAAVFVLDAVRDALLLRAFFGVADNVMSLAEPAFDAGQVWGVVDRVAPSAEHPAAAVVDVIVRPPGRLPPRVVAVEFRGADASLAQAFHRGDCLGLVCAEEAAGTLAYGAQTLAFVLPAAEKPPEPVAQPPRVWLSQLRADTSDLTLLVRVVAVSPNIPADADGEPFRRALRVADATASCDVTVWGALAQRTAVRLRAGQTVLLRGFDAHAEHGVVMLNGSTDIGSAIDCVSALPAIPHSAALRRLQPLDAIRAPASCYARASVTRVAPLDSALRDSRDLVKATKLVHAACGRRLARVEAGYECAKCAMLVTDTASVFALAVDLDDGTAVAHARVAAHVAATMLATTPEHFLKLPTRAAQLAALAKPLGLAFVVCLTAFNLQDNVSEPLLRIDAACPADDVGLLDE
ncbi:hypothetical protein GGI24_002770 [Coemansia furcata]|nr:hypothetical protein GGI24_002770 [Coemansia furcata]